MTVESNTNKKSYTANGIADTFAYDFLVFTADTMLVYLDGVQYLGNITVTGLGVQEGGTVQLADIPADQVVVTLYRMVPTLQESDYEPYTDFPAEQIERDYDLGVMIDQQITEEQGRTLVLNVASDPVIDAELPAPDPNGLFSWSPDGKSIIYVKIVDGIASFTVTPLNVPDAIVQRDNLGDFAARIATLEKLIGDVAADDGTVVLAAGTDGTDANFIGTVKGFVIRLATNVLTGLMRFATDGEALAGLLETVGINPKQLQASRILKHEYYSAGITIASAGQTILPHGLGLEPKLMLFGLKCLVAEHNYDVDDFVVLDATARGISPVVDDANITVRFNDSVASCFLVQDKTTGAGASATNTSWELYIKAFA